MYNNLIKSLEVALNSKFNQNNVFKKCKTIKGKTQTAELFYMDYVKQVFYEQSLNFDEASSQSPKDIRVTEPKLNFEVKKTDKTTIILNDTCPSSDVYYIYIITGTKKFKPHIKIINGQEFLNGNEWYEDYINEVNKLRDIYCRGLNKKCKNTPLKCYLRPRWSVDLTHFDLLEN